MADDTRDLTPSSTDAGQVTPQDPSSQPKRPKYETSKSQTAKLWDAFGGPEERANALPTYNGPGKTSDITVTEALKTLSMKDATTFYKTPCVRDAFMVGIGAGFGIGGVRGLIGGLRSTSKACNWAVGTFVLTSLIAHEFCQRRRTLELDGMKQAMELMQELKAKKQRDKELKAEQAAQLAEEEKQKKSWSNPSNYKFW